jgi:hypothetical protein
LNDGCRCENIKRDQKLGDRHLVSEAIQKTVATNIFIKNECGTDKGVVFILGVTRSHRVLKKPKTLFKCYFAFFNLRKTNLAQLITPRS